VSTSLRRLLGALSMLMVSLVVMPAGVSRADDLSVGLGSVTATSTATGSNFRGVLTLRSLVDAQVDARTLKIRVDGKEFKATLQQAPRLDRRAMLVIDTSGSMGAAGMATVRKAAASYLKTVPNDVKVGVASFADTAGVDLTPTLDRAAVQRVIDGLAARGDTSLYAGMRSAASVLTGAGDRSIVLLSDGADTVAPDRGKSLNDVVGMLRSSAIRVDVIRFRTDDADATASLHDFARVNGGSVSSADDTGAVAAAFQKAARTLDRQVQFSVALPTSLIGRHRYEIAGVADGTPFRFARDVVFTSSGLHGPAASAPATGPSAAETPQAVSGVGYAPTSGSSRIPYVAAGLLALGLFTALATSLTPTLTTKRERRVAAIESYVVGAPATMSRQQLKATQSTIAAQLLDVGERVMKDRKSTSQTLALIERADLPFRAGEWLVLRVVAIIVGAAIGLVLLGGSHLFGGLAGGALGLVGMPLFLRLAASRRAGKFESQLPQILLLVSTSLRSGFGLAQALDAVARDAANPAGKEFSRALAETRIGTDISDALERVGVRMESTSMRWAVMAIRVQREVGGNLADTLRTTAGTLRDRETLHRQVRSLSAEGRLSAYILVALPVGLFLYMMKANYDYISILWTTPLGIAMGIGALVALSVGILWMRQVVKIEV
jgi:tight adherence protein B